jgi:ribonuclease J
MMQFGPFRVTPHLVDHSAYDAYALEVEAGGRRLFYSGDIRAHGRKAALFERLVAHPPRSIDVMLMEGSSFGRLSPDHVFPTEIEVEQRMVDLLQATDGLALVAASAQNIDRMVSLYRACKRTGRTLIIDLYAAEIFARRGTISHSPTGRMWRSTCRSISESRSSAAAASTYSILTRPTVFSWNDLRI